MSEAKPRVLLVDDEKEFLESMSKVLNRRGFELLTAESGERALELVREHPIDVAVVDIKMPGIDGHRLLDLIVKEGKEIEVILLTGHATINSAVVGMRQGAFDYLAKPQDPDDLSKAIRRAAARKAQREADRLSEEVERIVRRGF